MLSLFNSLSDALKDRLKSYVDVDKNDSSLISRINQKKDFERVASLLDLDVVKSRKLSLDFVSEEPKNVFLDLSDKNKDDDSAEDVVDENNFSFSFKEDVSLGCVSFDDVLSYFRGRGVVGEESLCLKIFLAASNNLSFGVEGFSGSGKTFVVDKLIDLFDVNDLYRLDLSSKMAVFYDSKNINGFRTIYIPELQKALQDTKSPIVEVVKNLTEGKDVKRVVTDYKNKGSKVFNITKGKSVIYTLASENYFKKDEELNRRFLRFKTNSSEEHLDDVLNSKSLKRQDFSFFEDVDSLKSKLKNYFGFLRNLDVKIFDPYCSYLSDFLPRTQKSVGYVDHYFSLVDAVTRFNFKDRFLFKYGDKDVVVSELEDHFVVHKLYYSEFLDTLSGFSERNNFDDELLLIQDLRKKFVDWDVAFSKGLEVSKNNLGDNFYKYVSRLNSNNYVHDMKEKYSFLSY
ncbi:hypothetical protein KO361_00675 [Candidatus Woesearchaeota archaeon]|nr:hypothetical protein [Candidatus Woesearchaeota archaeon]